MRMPNAEQAEVPNRKIREYLLNVMHPEGGSKARYFLGFGYSLDDVARFRRDLVRLAVETEMERTMTPFGTEFSGTGTVTTPDGRQIRVRTVWILLDGSLPPRLITAYPGR